MIVVEDVRQTPHEMRLVLAAWPVVRTWGLAVRLWLAATFVTTAALILWPFDIDRNLWLLVSFYAMIVGVIALSLIANRRISKAARAAPLGDAPSRWVLDETGLRIEHALSTQSLDWRAVVRVVEERDRIIFAVLPSRNHVLPLRCLRPDQQEAVRKLIAEASESGRLGAGVD